MLHENNMQIQEGRRENTWHFLQEKWSGKVLLFPLSSHSFSFLTVSMGQVGFSIRTIRICVYPAAIKKGFKVFSNPAGPQCSVIYRAVPSRSTTVCLSKAQCKGHDTVSFSPFPWIWGGFRPWRVMRSHPGCRNLMTFTHRIICVVIIQQTYALWSESFRGCRTEEPGQQRRWCVVYDKQIFLSLKNEACAAFIWKQRNNFFQCMCNKTKEKSSFHGSCWESGPEKPSACSVLQNLRDFIWMTDKWELVGLSFEASTMW